MKPGEKYSELTGEILTELQAVESSSIQIARIIDDLPDLWVTDEVKERLRSVLAIIARAAENENSSLRNGGDCKDCCRTKSLISKYWQEMSLLFSSLFFNSIIVTRRTIAGEFSFDSINAGLENTLTQKSRIEGACGKNKTQAATAAAQMSRVDEWKGFAVVMAKIAYDCGLEDRKQVARSEYAKIAKKHGELSSTALELLRDALPEGVTKKTGGASSQG